MLLERYYEDSLAQATYLIACEQAREAIVIDPNRDVGRFIAAAAAHRFRIAYVTETHIHADFLSGSRALARATKAGLLLSGHGGSAWQYGFAGSDGARLLREGDTIEVGRVRLSVMHTPGHTPEHISFLVTDTAVGDRPMGMITGDFLFVGDVGRPDLLERAANVAGTMDAAARDLYASLRRLKDLPDYLQVWPGHGAGSACGKALGAVPQSTLGYERLFNPAFQKHDEAEFVRWVLSEQPEPPRYFAEMKRLNRDGPPPPRPDVMPPELDASALRGALGDGSWVVDVRGSRDFAKGHARGSINIPASKSFLTYAGTVVSFDRPMVLITRSADQAAAIVGQLRLIGFDGVTGWVQYSTVTVSPAQGVPIARLPLIEPKVLAERMSSNGPRVVDVRGLVEWRQGHLPRATHIFFGDVERAAPGELDKHEPIVIHCESGTRSSIAASILMARGYTDVTNMAGGIVAWRDAGLPVES